MSVRTHRQKVAPSMEELGTFLGARFCRRHRRRRRRSSSNRRRNPELLTHCFCIPSALEKQGARRPATPGARTRDIYSSHSFSIRATRRRTEFNANDPARVLFELDRSGSKDALLSLRSPYLAAMTINVILRETIPRAFSLAYLLKKEGGLVVSRSAVPRPGSFVPLLFFLCCTLPLAYMS